MPPPRPLPAAGLSRRALLMLAALGWGAGASAAGRDPRILTAPDAALQRNLLQALRARYPGLLADPDPMVLESRRAAAGPLVALGPAALRRALQPDVKGPVVSLLTSSQNWRQISAASGREPGGATAIHAEAPPRAQLQLIATLFERRVTAGVLLSEASAYMERSLRQAAAAVGVDLAVERTDAGEVVRALNRLGGSHVLLAVPDSALYTPDTLRSVLESTYRRGLPVVGFSAATVAAGTLATAYCAIDDVVADLALLLDELPASGPLPEARHPMYWRVTVNEHVARSLGIPITDKVLGLGNQPSGKPG